MTNEHIVLGLLVLAVGVVLFGGLVMGDGNTPSAKAVSFDAPYPPHLTHYFPNDDDHADAETTTDVVNGLNLSFGSNVGPGTGYNGQGIEFRMSKPGVVQFDAVPQIDESAGWTITFWTDDVGSNGNQLNTVDVFYTRNGLDNAVLSWDNRLGYSMNGCGQHLRVSPAVGEEWKHVALTYDGDTATFYLNGVKVHTSSCTGNTNFFAADSQLGWHAAAATPDTSMDEITLHDHALTKGEVNQVMSGIRTGHAWKKITTKAKTIFLSPPGHTNNPELPN